jgi:hypothetical protein
MTKPPAASAVSVVTCTAAGSHASKDSDRSAASLFDGSSGASITWCPPSPTGAGTAAHGVETNTAARPHMERRETWRSRV